MAKTWKQKLQGGKPAHVEVLPRPYAGAPEGARMLVATPALVDAYMRDTRLGEARTIAAMRDDLASRHGADIACPMSTAIFARIAAEAALDDLRQGAPLETITPFWRVIEPRGSAARKLSCGSDFIEERRAEESLSAQSTRGIEPDAPDA